MPAPPPRASRWLALRRRLRRLYVRVIRSPGDPRDVAIGMAIGIFVSFIPVAQTLIALGIVGVVRRMTGVKASYLAAAAGTWFTNPLTAAPVYALSLLVGRPIAHGLLGITDLGAVAVPGTWFSGPAVLETALAMLFGGLILGIPLAVTAYHATRRLVAGYQARRVARQRERALRAIGAPDLLLTKVDEPRAASGS